MDTEVGTQGLVVVLEDAEEEVVQVADQELNPVDQVIQVIMDTELMDMHQDQVEAAVPVRLAVLMGVMEDLFQVLNFLELTLAEDLDQVDLENDDHIKQRERQHLWGYNVFFAEYTRDKRLLQLGAEERSNRKLEPRGFQTTQRQQDTTGKLFSTPL